MQSKMLASITFAAGLGLGTLGSWLLWMQAEPHTAWLVRGMARMEVAKRLGNAERAGDVEETLYLQRRLVDIAAPSGDRYLRLAADFYSWSDPIGGLVLAHPSTDHDSTQEGFARLRLARRLELAGKDDQATAEYTRAAKLLPKHGDRATLTRIADTLIKTDRESFLAIDKLGL